MPKTAVQEVASDEPGVRIFVVRSEERLEYERSQRLRAMAEVRQELQALAARIKQGKLKAPAKIGAGAEPIIGRHHGYRYYDWQYDQDGFRFFEHPVNLQARRRSKANTSSAPKNTISPRCRPSASTKN